MYTVEIEYFRTEWGKVWASLRVVDGPDSLGNGLFRGDVETITPLFDCWEALERHVETLLDDAKKEAVRRRALKANHPPPRKVQF